MSFQRINKKSSLKHKKRTKKPEWDATVSDLTVHKMSPEEQARRKQVHRSSNLEAVKKEQTERSLRRANASSLDDSSKSAFIREILYDQTQLSDVVAHTDRVMSVVKDLFADDPHRREAFPNVTLAPQPSNVQQSLQGPVYMRPHSESQLSALSDTIMDRYALNDVTSSSQDSTMEQASSDEEKENVPLNFPQSVVDMNRFHRFIASQQQKPSKPDIQMRPERGPRNKILHDHGNMRKTHDAKQTASASDVSFDTSVEMPHLAINDTTKVKKKSRKRIDQEETEAETNRIDIRKVMQGGDVFASDRHVGTSQSKGYTTTLLNSIKRLDNCITQHDVYLKEEQNHRIKLQEQLQQQQSLIDALTEDAMNMKDLLLQLTSQAATNQQVHQISTRLHEQHVQPQNANGMTMEIGRQQESLQDSNHQHSFPYKTEDTRRVMNRPGDQEQQPSLPNKKSMDGLPTAAPERSGDGVTANQRELFSSSQDNLSHSHADGVPSGIIPDPPIPSLPEKSHLSYVGSLSHVQPSMTALMLSPPRQKDRSILSKPQGMRHLHGNLPENDDVQFNQPQYAGDGIYNTDIPNAKVPTQNIAAFNARTQNTRSNSFDVSNFSTKPTSFATTINHPESMSGHYQQIKYDHGIFPILQTTLKEVTKVSEAQLDINRKMQALSQEHAEAQLRLAKLQTGLPAFQEKSTNLQSLILSPAVSPIPFEVETQNHPSSAGAVQAQKITVSLPRVEELEISATSTPSPKSNLSDLIKRQSTSGDCSSKQNKNIIHQGSTPLAASRQKGTDEGFFALTAHVGK
ncbi:uncharacterized protein [Antedon mediterranea]|uniref:uncharacterized protein n=1 Tax=Antedon mediterranea TaxID=105859 RepID=UPI003AF5F28D